MWLRRMITQRPVNGSTVTLPRAIIPMSRIVQNLGGLSPVSHQVLFSLDGGT